MDKKKEPGYEMRKYQAKKIQGWVGFAEVAIWGVLILGGIYRLIEWLIGLGNK